MNDLSAQLLFAKNEIKRLIRKSMRNVFILQKGDTPLIYFYFYFFLP